MQTYITTYIITTSDAQSDPPSLWEKSLRLPAANVLEKLRNIWVLLRKKSGFLGSHGSTPMCSKSSRLSRCWGPNKDWSENVFEHFAEMMQLPGGFVPGQKKKLFPDITGCHGPPEEWH